MSSGLSETVTIQTNISLISEWEGQLLQLSLRKRLLQKYSSNEIDQIRAKYAPQKEAIKNQIASLEDGSRASEYQTLMSELNELDNMEDMEIKAAEEKANQQEGDIQLQIDGLESRKKAATEDNESFKEMRKQNTERSFGYCKT